MKKAGGVAPTTGSVTDTPQPPSTQSTASFSSSQYPSTYQTPSSSQKRPSKSVPYEIEDGKITVGNYTYDQDNFWKGRIPGVRQTYPFPRTRPIIFHNEVVGMPVQFGPYGKYTKGPPSPPPPSPVCNDDFPKQPECCCFRLKSKHRKRKDNQDMAFGIKTTDPNADFSLDKTGFDCCTIMQYHISPHFRYKKFQRRFVFRMMLMIVLYYLPVLAVLFILLFEKNCHHFLMLNTNFNSCVAILSVTFTFYLVLAWFSGLARYRYWPITAISIRWILITVCACSVAIGTEHLSLMYAIEEDEDDDGHSNIEKQLDVPHSYGYWPALGFVYESLFRITFAFVTKYTKCHISDFGMKIVLYIFLWFLFCLQGTLLFTDYSFGIFYGPQAVDVAQTTLALFTAVLLSLNTVRNFHRLFAGRLCALTEKEYLYCLLRLAN